MTDTGWMPRIGDVIRYGYSFLSPSTKKPETFYMEARVVGTEDAPPTLHLDDTGTLVRNAAGWELPEGAWCKPVTPIGVWDIDGAPLAPGRDSFPLPERPAGLPFPGEVVTVTVSNGRVLRTSILASTDIFFRLAVYPNEPVNLDGTVRTSAMRILSMVDAHGQERLPGSLAAVSGPAR